MGSILAWGIHSLLSRCDDITAEIRAGYHEPLVMTPIADDTASSGSEAWRLLFIELAEHFSRQEIEAYSDEIKDSIRKLISDGALGEQAVGPKRAAL
jgi:hypothetical protein